MNITEQSTIKNDLARIKSLNAQEVLHRPGTSIHGLLEKKNLEPIQRGDRLIRLKYILNYIRNLMLLQFFYSFCSVYPQQALRS